MKRKLCLGIFIAVLSCVIGFTYAKDNTKFITKTDPQPQKFTPIINASNKFGLDIFKSEISKKKNAVISPISIFTLFSIIENGANGETKTQIKNVMKIKAYSNEKLNNDMNNLINWLSPSKKSKYASIAQLYNSIWIDDAFQVKDSFIKTSKAYYNSETFTQNLPTDKTVKDMNQWISNKSKGLINNPIKKIDGDTALAIMNVLYFNDKWITPFDKAATKTEKFTLKNSSTINLKMMNGKRNIRYYEDTYAKAGILDYSRGSMMIILPKGDIDAFSAKLTMEDISKYSSNADLSETNIKFPILNLNYGNSLKNTLKKLGMSLAFDSKNANLNNTKTDESPLWIGDIFHNCVVKVDEEGTKAAALSHMEIKLTCAVAPDKVKDLYLNKPFIFVIKDKSSDLILFMAKVDNPNLKN